MPTEAFELDRAERGELRAHGNLTADSTTQTHGGSIKHASDPVDQIHGPVAHAQPESDALERACGPLGLARVKDYDRRFAFYPGFSVERSLALEFRAEGITQLSKEIRTLRKEVETADSGKSSIQPPTDTAERLANLMSRLAESMAQYDAAWVHGKIVDNINAPEESSLSQLRLWLEQQSAGQIDMYRNREWHEFRMLSLPKGPIERLIKVLAPLTKIGRIIFRPFRSHKAHVGNLQFLRYEDAVLSWVVGVVLLLGICVFLILPLTFLTYFDCNRNIRMALILVMCFLVSIFARVVEPDEARQIIFICVYSAVMSGFLSQVT